MSHNAYLAEMGITTWVSKDAASVAVAVSETPVVAEKALQPVWTFIAPQMAGDARVLFDRILAALMLTPGDIELLTPQQAKDQPVGGQVVVAMGQRMGQELLGESDPFEELRGAVHALEVAGQEVPVILTYDPEHLLKKPADKAKVWQDLLLAKSLF